MASQPAKRDQAALEAAAHRRIAMSLSPAGSSGVFLTPASGELGYYLRAADAYNSPALTGEISRVERLNSVTEQLARVSAWRSEAKIAAQRSQVCALLTTAELNLLTAHSNRLSFRSFKALFIANFDDAKEWLEEAMLITNSTALSQRPFHLQLQQLKQWQLSLCVSECLAQGFPPPSPASPPVSLRLTSRPSPRPRTRRQSL